VFSFVPGWFFHKRGYAAKKPSISEDSTAPVFGREALVLAELDLDAIPRAKFDLDVAGHYARPDLLRLALGDTDPHYASKSSSH
jgi:nitrilase